MNTVPFDRYAEMAREWTRWGISPWHPTLGVESILRKSLTRDIVVDAPDNPILRAKARLEYLMRADVQAAIGQGRYVQCTTYAFSVVGYE